VSQRHRWYKLRVHVYICTRCGTGRVNAQRTSGEWFTTFHRPNSHSVVSPRVPPCERGPHTEKYLAKYAIELSRARAFAGEESRR
jgi:hypothetical protein